MMLTISTEDFANLSISCQRELMVLLGFIVESDYADGDESIPYEFLPEQISGEEQYSPTSESRDMPSTAKQVIDITESEARDLVANISGRSIETLRFFATGEPVALDDLIGKAREYTTMLDLKRSFVGAVNRRLRTVTGNRRAVLFLTVSSNSSDQTAKIAVRPETAAALKMVMNE